MDRGLLPEGGISSIFPAARDKAIDLGAEILRAAEEEARNEPEVLTEQESTGLPRIFQPQP